MRKLLAVAFLLASSMSATQVGAMTLSGACEKTDIIQQPVVIERSNVEGRIGIRVSSYGSVAYVHPGSPAERAGIQKHDLITRVDGRKHAIEAISGEPGTKVQLEVKRGFQHFLVDVPRVDFRGIEP